MEKKVNNTAKYQVFAQVYDRLMNQENYKDWANLIKEVISKYRISSGLALDLACGTGSISKILVDLGFDVVGIDKSKKMLEIAKNKVAKAQFILADLRNFKIENKTKINLAVCFYDSLNYLTAPSDFLATLKNIAVNIPKGSIFLFDVNPPEKIEKAQQFEPQIYEDEEYEVKIYSSGNDLFWNIKIEIKDKKKNQIFIENHSERAYAEKEVATFLKQANFDLLEVRRQYSQGNNDRPYLNRLHFITRKG